MPEKGNGNGAMRKRSSTSSWILATSASIWTRSSRGDTSGRMAAIRLELHRAHDLHARQALEDEVGRAILVPDGDTNKPEAGHLAGRFPLPIRFLHGHGKHAIAAQGIGEHLAVARLENIKRQKR